jgi:Protein of unknown function (DUF2950)
MRIAFALLLAVGFASCDAVVVESGVDRATLDMEVNETLTISHIKSIVGAQTQVQALSVVDTDADGTGEYLFLDELSGARLPRAPGSGLRFPLVIDDFKHRGSGNFAEVHGYLYRLFIPGGEGGEVDHGVADADLSEARWSCYAWPAEYGRTGRRSFFVNETGVVRAKEAPALSGGHAPEPNTALGGGEDGGETAWPALD